MEENLKQLLLKDLCGRLPYYTWVQYDGEKWLMTGYGHGRVSLLTSIFSSTAGPCPLIVDVKLYLRPMSSMTEGEKEEYRNECNKVLSMPFKVNGPYPIVDWLNAHHFDHRGLIPMGLALEAPEDMYKQ